MFKFLQDLFRRDFSGSRVAILDNNGSPRSEYLLVPRWIAAIVVLYSLFLITSTVLLLSHTNLRHMIPGYPTPEALREARLAELRLAALQDTLAMQEQYLIRIRQILTGEIDAIAAGTAPEDIDLHDPWASEILDYGDASVDWEHHQQPAMPLRRMPVGGETAMHLAVSAPRGYLSALRLPAEPPVTGFVTRHFDARRGHFGIDIAVEEGSMVRSIGDGYVIFSDWTHEAGWVIALQHAGGYVSLYKHNSRLLKQVGDRVREREAVAASGGAGALSTGPHLHFELWHDGLAQDPRQFLVGL